MKKIILIFIFALSATSICLALTNSTESLTITTYYPSPYGVYRNLKLNPAEVPPSGAALSPGVMYYDNTSDTIVYYNKADKWVNLTGGGVGGGVGGNDTYWNETGAQHIYNNNTGFVGIGTQAPETPLMVQKSNSASADATVASFIKHVNGVNIDQYLLFNLYPSNAWVPYLNSTSVIHVPKDPPENLEVAVGNQTNHIRLNVGGYHSDYSEVMRLVNSNGAHLTADPADPRVGIGTTNPLFTLHVENNQDITGPLMVRGTRNGRKTGIFHIIPWKDRVYLGFGMYGRADHFYVDPYEFPAGVYNNKASKLCIRPGGPNDGYKGVWWYSRDLAKPLGPGGRINDWIEENLWNKCGTWSAPCVPASSRKLKANFAGIKPDDILGKIDQLEVCRWNYKSDNKTVTHIGPMAEDFYRLFKTGSRDDQLNLIDSAGVSLAGVKALLTKASRQEQRLEELGQEIKDLKVQLGKKRAGK